MSSNNLEAPSSLAPTPVVTQPASEPKKKLNNRRCGKQREPGVIPPRREPPKFDTNAFKAKHVSTAYTAEKNDPLINVTEALYDGGMGFSEIDQSLEFHLDYTGYVNLISVSYEKMITADRSISKYISSSMYAYYCTVLLWRRLMQVTAVKQLKTLEYSVVRETVNEDLPIPADLSAYLNGLGNVRDHEDNQTWLRLQAGITGLTVKGTPGFYGRITANNHWKYETLPAPGISVLRILADIEYTEASKAERAQLRDWNLPDSLVPAAEGALLPTVSLLGWRRAEMLTEFQLQLLRGANFDHERAEMQDAYGIPVCQPLLDGIGGYLRSSKATSHGSLSPTTQGSMAIVPWCVKINDDNDEDLESPGSVTPYSLITGKQSKAQSPTQIGATISSCALVFKYRFDRSDKSGTNMDGFCYRFSSLVPATWIANRNSVFHFGVCGSNWNRAGFGSAECNGEAIQRAYCDNMRAKTARK